MKKLHLVIALALWVGCASILRAQSANANYPEGQLAPAYASDTGSVNALAARVNSCQAPVAGQLIRVLPGNANTLTAPTLAWCGASAKTITKNGQSAVASNDLVTTEVALFIYDGTYMELIDPATAVTPTTLDNGTLAASFASVAVPSDGVHSGYDNLIGNTANQPVVPNTAGFMGPSSASFTAYAVQLPTAAPSASSVMVVGAPTSSVSQASFSGLAGAGAAIPTGPASSTSGDLVSFTGIVGQEQDSGIPSTAIPQADIAPATYYAQGYGAGGYTFNPGGAENVDCAGFIVAPGGLSVGHVAFDVTTAGGSGAGNNSDIGIFNSSGTRIAHVGASVMNTTGNVVFTFSGGTQAIPAGKNYFCLTTAGTTLVLGGSGGSTFSPFAYISTTGSSGALPTTITPATDAPSSSTGSVAFVLYP